ncbi:uncharacterized protein K489DRAFT_385084 [Dissoconium aciculare CBS 342.82]|uniref:Uncharacterized protein n=1 Tax=Dissoconium aciculare CBS 342.82 TaxID=1314786 RepID=A0A6J3LR09_9PEZI|nr:uncharacterized protein K489DRAFT_385084 [Dissoconium aciculare CBS 342.82]KAF1818296.1 hypothetical protein K489DRAFT_385084 [Dissoconium aciculare CBS 342.82]
MCDYRSSTRDTHGGIYIYPGLHQPYRWPGLSNGEERRRTRGIQLEETGPNNPSMGMSQICRVSPEPPPPPPPPDDGNATWIFHRLRLEEREERQIVGASSFCTSAVYRRPLALYCTIIVPLDRKHHKDDSSLSCRMFDSRMDRT